MIQNNNLAEEVELNNIPDTALIGSEVAMVRAIQVARNMDPCFRTEQRLLCENEKCEWWKDCRRLVAVWRR